MGSKTKSYLLIMLGVALTIVGTNMYLAENKWDETISATTDVPGTKKRNAAIGAGVGFVGGGILAAVVGGIGVVAMGTGVGAPAGLGLIAAASAMGAGAGAVTGAATGTSDTTKTDTTTITQMAPAYETWQWACIFTIAGVLFFLAILELRKLRVVTNEAEESNGPIDGEGIDSAASSPMS